MNLVAIVRSWLSRSMENPRTPLDPWGPGAGDDVLGGESSTGMKVSRRKALTYSAVWRCVNLVSRTFAKLPLGVYRNLDPGRTPDYDHPADYLIRCRPNPYMIPFAWKQTTMGHVLLNGNGYSYIARDGANRATDLLPLDPEKVIPVRENGRLWYCHDNGTLDPDWIDPADMIHLKGLGYDGLEGYSVIRMMAEGLGLGLAMQKYSAVYFRNSARPSVVLSYPGRLSPEARRKLRESWERLNSGIENAHRTAILEEGIVPKELTISARDSQLIEGKNWSLIDVANSFHVPPHRVGSMVNVSYGSLQEENQAFADDGVEPWLISFQEELETKLLSDRGRRRGTHSIDFDRKNLVREKSSDRYAGYTQAVASGIKNQDECREEEGMNPIEGGIGAKYYRPGNLVPLDPDDVPPPAPVAAPGTPGIDPLAKKKGRKRFDEDQSREPNGQFDSGGGSGDSGDDSSDYDIQNARDDEDADIAEAREKEDERDEKAYDKIDAAQDKLADAREREDEKLEKVRDREDAASEKAQAQADKAYDKEDKATEKARDAEDKAGIAALKEYDKAYDAKADEIADARDAEDVDAKDAREDEDIETANRRDAEDGEDAPSDETVAAREAEDADTEAKRDAEDEAVNARRGAEDEARDDEYKAHVAGEDAREKEAIARRDEEDKATQAKRDEEDAARAEADEARYAAREEEDAAGMANREEEDAAIAAQFAAHQAMRDEKAAARKREDDELAAKRKKEDDERKGSRSLPPPSPDLAASHRALLADAARRAVRRVGHQAARAAKKPATFLAWLDAMAIDAPANVADGLLARVRADLLEASGRAKDAPTLAAEVAAALAIIESDPLSGVLP